MIQKYKFQIFQKLAIAVTITAAFYCPTLTAETILKNVPKNIETVQISNAHSQVVQMKDGSALSFAEIFKIDKEGNNAITMQIASRSERQKYYQYRTDLADQEKTELDTKLAQATERVAKLDTQLAQTTERVVKLDVALKLSKEFGLALDEIFKQKSFKTATPEQKASNKNHGNAILAALANPLAHKLPPATKLVMEEFALKLQTGEDYDLAYKKLMSTVYSTSK